MTKKETGDVTAILKKAGSLFQKLNSNVLAATVISLDSLVNKTPFRASRIPFLCFMVLHFECPDIIFSLFTKFPALF